MIRLFDVVFSAMALLVLVPIFAAVMLVGCLVKSSPIIFRQVRIGRDQAEFTLYKLRTMDINAKNAASHFMSGSDVTKFGAFARKTKLDELPQLWNVVRGDMSLVGPRPCLPNQLELIKAREARGVFDVRPGITGLAQISGIDMSSPERLADVDASMVKSMSLGNYFRYIALTTLGRGFGDQIRHH